MSLFAFSIPIFLVHSPLCIDGVTCLAVYPYQSSRASEQKISSYREPVDIRSLLDRRSYRIYRLRTDENKTFLEIAAITGLSRSRVQQIYQASSQRIALKKRGGDIWPEFSLSLRGIHCIHRAFKKKKITKRDVIWALKTGKLSPGKVHNYGWKTHREVCKWAGVL